MNQLEKRFNEKIEDLKLTVFEWTGMKLHPKLAIKVGMGVGYQMALDDAKASLNKAVKTEQKLL